MNDLRIHRVTFGGDTMSVVFSDERTISVPVRFFPRLALAEPLQRERWELIGRGLGVHWEALDKDLSVESILSAYSRSKAGEYARVTAPVP